MKILVVGSGGREHAIVWKIAQSPLVTELYCAPGNAGIAGQAKLVPIPATDVDGLVAFAKENAINLTVVGPEAPLVEGLSDKLASAGLLAFGASQAGAQLEGSKAFTKELLKRKGVPTADFGVFTDPADAKAFVKELGKPVAIKADGLAAGKGVLLCKTVEEADAAIDQVMVTKDFGDAGEKVVVEELLEGEEASFIAFADENTVLPLATSQDHKRVFDGDQGLNTGGMGAYSPAPVVDPAMHDKIVKEVLEPTIEGLSEMGIQFRGVLYAGLMIKDGVPSVLEYNVRLGDPECQPLMMRITSDIVPVMMACAKGELEGQSIEWDERPSVCVVMAAGGYPEKYGKGYEITGLDDAAKMDDVFVFHAGTKGENGKIVTSGGRVLGVTALGDDIGAAIDRAYKACGAIGWEGVHYRRDIGFRALNR